MRLTPARGCAHYNVAPTIAHFAVEVSPAGVISGAANMQAVSGPNLWLAAGVLACSALACAPQPHGSDSAPAPLTPVAGSALVTLEAGPAAAGLVLRLRHTADGTAVSVTDLTVSDRKSVV